MATITLPETHEEQASQNRVKYVYFFGGGNADGNGKMKDELGGKGAGLAEMTNAGLPVPPGFTIQTEACREYMRGTRPRSRPPRCTRRLAASNRLQGQKLGTGRQSAAGQRALGREVLHARHDGYDSQSRPERSRAWRRWPSAAIIRVSPTTPTGASSRCSATSCWRFRSSSLTKSSTPRRNRRRPSSIPISTPRR